MEKHYEQTASFLQYESWMLGYSFRIPNRDRSDMKITGVANDTDQLTTGWAAWQESIQMGSLRLHFLGGIQGVAMLELQRICTNGVAQGQD